MSSSRLPRKVLEDIAGVSMLQRVWERAVEIGYPAMIAVPTQDAELIEPWCENWYLGPDEDVLLRYVKAARLCGADHVIRVTADCPLLDPEAARFTVLHHLETDADLTLYEAEGRSVQVFKREALERAGRQSNWSDDPTYREHPDEWILDGEYYGTFGREKIVRMKFSVDTQEDLDKVRRWLDG